MYCPPHFRADPAEALSLLARAPRLGFLVCNGTAAPSVSPVPLLLRDGALIGHLARANPQAAALAAAGRAVAVFPGPEAYVSPSFYPSKALHHRVVPTWNYEVVTIEGAASVIEDAAALHAIVSALTDAAEAGRESPWAVADAPPAFVAGQLKGILGVRIMAETVIAKRKASQNKDAADREGVRAGL
ncbi:MAG: FMN-binding negative transcriptional regulator, partial [Acetobacteraceae bacterium]|nr:FMN-binding negative transcriptional regulator [Acetobacteraceae bacterium]